MADYGYFRRRLISNGTTILNDTDITVTKLTFKNNDIKVDITNCLEDMAIAKLGNGSCDITGPTGPVGELPSLGIELVNGNTALVPTIQGLNLGSLSQPFGDIHLSANSIYLGTAVISENAEGGINLPANSTINEGSLGATGPAGPQGIQGIVGPTGPIACGGGGGSVQTTQIQDGIDIFSYSNNYTISDIGGAHFLNFNNNVSIGDSICLKSNQLIIYAYVTSLQTNEVQIQFNTNDNLYLTYNYTSLIHYKYSPINNNTCFYELRLTSSTYNSLSSPLPIPIFLPDLTISRAISVLIKVSTIVVPDVHFLFMPRKTQKLNDTILPLREIIHYGNSDSLLALDFRSDGYASWFLF
jgi:hypothetical protein